MLNRLRIQALSTALATDAHLPHALENLGGGLLDSLSIRADGDASKLFDKCPGLIHLRTDALGIGVEMRPKTFPGSTENRDAGGSTPGTRGMFATRYPR